MSTNQEDELIRAAESGDLARVEALLAGGVYVNEKDADGDTALWVAANEGHVGCLKALLGAGANVDSMEEGEGWTALMVAANQGHLACVEALVAAGALLRLEDEEGRTAEDLAWAAGAKEVEAFLAAARREQKAAWEAQWNAERLDDVLPKGQKEEGERGRF